MDEPRIVYVITDLLTGGVPLHLARLAPAVRDAGHQVSVISLARPAEVACRLVERGIDVQSCQAGGRFDLGVIFHLRRLLAETRPDIVHSLLFHANLAARLAGPLAGVRPARLICEVQTVELERRWHLRLDRWTSGLCRCEVGNSPAVVQHLARTGGLSESRLRLLPGGVDTAPFDRAEPLPREDLGLDSEDRLLLWVGRLDPVKGLLDLLQAMTLLEPEAPLKLWLVGEGAQRPALAHGIEQLDLQHRVHLAGIRADVPALLKSCDLFVFPSLTEGMPNALLEAMAASCPIVCSDIAAHRHLVEDGRSAVLFPAGDAAALAGAMSNLLADSPRRLALGRRAHETVAARFTQRDVVHRYLDLYRDVLKQVGRRHGPP